VGENHKRMNQSVIHIINKKIFVSFEKIVRAGSIQLKDKTGRVIILEKGIQDSNFLQIEFNQPAGSYRLEMLIDNIKSSRKINIK